LDTGFLIREEVQSDCSSKRQCWVWKDQIFITKTSKNDIPAEARVNVISSGQAAEEPRIQETLRLDQ
jgi:hypothetical protein